MARVDHLDTLKALAIWLVVLGHTIQGTDADYWHNGVFLLIYSVHMPLFALLSGYFFHADDGVWLTVRRKTVQLIVPCITWGILEMCVSIAQHVPEHFMNVIKPTVLYSQWFIKCMWVCSLLSLLPCLLPWLRGAWRKMVMAVALCLLLTLSCIGNLFWVSFLLPFYFVGILLKHHQVQLQTISTGRRALYITLLTIAFVILYLWWDGSKTIYITPIAPIANGAINVDNILTALLRWALGLIGCLAIVMLSPWIHSCVPAFMKHTVLRIGRRTKGIYIIHTTSLFQLGSLCAAVPVCGGGYTLTAVVLSIIITFAASLLTMLLERNRVTACLALGINRR